MCYYVNSGENVGIVSRRNKESKTFIIIYLKAELSNSDYSCTAAHHMLGDESLPALE